MSFQSKFYPSLFQYHLTFTLLNVHKLGHVPINIKHLTYPTTSVVSMICAIVDVVAYQMTMSLLSLVCAMKNDLFLCCTY